MSRFGPSDKARWRKEGVWIVWPVIFASLLILLSVVFEWPAWYSSLFDSHYAVLAPYLVVGPAIVAGQVARRFWVKT
ncbi:MAG TPA: hypothetical protein VNA25_05860 [Phycisphaerae bacterium]|nr:hypothetical protein [Phycisphaerae bacterium]